MKKMILAAAMLLTVNATWTTWLMPLTNTKPPQTQGDTIYLTAPGAGLPMGTSLVGVQAPVTGQQVRPLAKPVPF